MNKEQTVGVLKAITTYYPNFKMDDPKATVTAWHLILQDYEINNVMANLAVYVKNNRFPPSVADLIHVEQPKDRAIPNYNETKELINKWDSEKANKASKETAQKALADIRAILGINRR